MARSTASFNFQVVSTWGASASSYPTPLHLSRRLSVLPQIICRCVPVRTCALTQVVGCLSHRPMMHVCPASPQPVSPTPGVRCFLMHFPKVCQQPCDKGQSRRQHRAPSRSYLHPSVGSILITNTLVVVSQGDKGDGPAGFFTSHCLPCPNPRFHFPHSSESDL